MTLLFVSFKATLKAMNAIKFQILILLQLYVIYIKKITGTVLFPNDFPVKTLTQLCTDDFSVRAHCSLGKSEIAKINVFILGPKPQKMK